MGNHLLFRVLVGLVLLISSLAYGDELENAKGAYDKALNDYYQAEKANPGGSEKPLIQKYLQPAAQELSQARAEAVKKAYQEAFPDGRMKKGKTIPITKAHMTGRQGPGNGKPGSKHAPTAVMQPASPSSADIQRSDIHVDANGVPSVVDFGSSGDKPQPKPSPSDVIVEPGIHGR